MSSPTPEMIEAGVAALRAAANTPDRWGVGAVDTVASIFDAMENARPADHRAAGMSFTLTIDAEAAHRELDRLIAKAMQLEALRLSPIVRDIG